MRFFTLASVAAATWTSVYAQSAASASATGSAATAATSATGTASGNGTSHVVTVGGQGQLVFTPNQVTAAVGDLLVFEFLDKNHTVTQSTFAAPCTHLNNATSNQVGFDSGYTPVAAGATNVPIWTLEVKSTDPIWVYCKQGTHCQQGMVMAVNAATTGPKTFQAFLTAAKASGNATTASTGATATGTPSSTDSGTSSTAGKTSGATSLVAQSGLALLFTATVVAFTL